jgi:hypothetical protein
MSHIFRKKRKRVKMDGRWDLRGVGVGDGEGDDARPEA